MSFYDARVLVNWTKSSWNNEGIFYWWLTTDLLPVLEDQPSLLVMDCAECHKTSRILSLLQQHDIVSSIVPSGCTGLIQPLDVSFNRPFKDRLQAITEKVIVEIQKDVLHREKWSIGERRIAIVR